MSHTYERTYIGPHDEVEVAGHVVKRGQSIEVDKELADGLDEQPDNWATPGKPVAKQAARKPRPTKKDEPVEPVTDGPDVVAPTDTTEDEG